MLCMSAELEHRTALHIVREPKGDRVIVLVRNDSLEDIGNTFRKSLINLELYCVEPDTVLLSNSEPLIKPELLTLMCTHVQNPLASNIRTCECRHNYLLFDQHSEQLCSSILSSQKIVIG